LPALLAEEILRDNVFWQAFIIINSLQNIQQERKLTSACSSLYTLAGHSRRSAVRTECIVCLPKTKYYGICIISTLVIRSFLWQLYDYVVHFFCKFCSTFLNNNRMIFLGVEVNMSKNTEKS